jgi:hypothetical protein
VAESLPFVGTVFCAGLTDVFEKAPFCKPLVCALALDAPVLAVRLSRSAALLAGRIILGKTEAADSVSGPALEKKTENGV